MTVKKNINFLEETFLGHSVNKWNPQSSTYLLGHYQGSFILDLEQSHFLWKRSLRLIDKVIKERGDLLWVASSPEISKIIQVAATKCGHPYAIKQWVGGTLTNWKKMGWPSLPACIFVVETHFNPTIIKEANLLNIPIIGLIDSNVNIEGITYPIPSNDDSLLSIYNYCDSLTTYILNRKIKYSSKN